MNTENRRPLKTRGAAWASVLAAQIGKVGITPDAISLLSVAFAALGAAVLLVGGAADGGARAVWFLIAAVFIQLRLLANMLDGMVAVEQGKGGPLGPIWNELPDRIADALFLVAAGYAAEGSGFPYMGWLGWLAAVLAVMTAYVRELGRGLGFPADFSGPMAKPHRMAALTLVCLASMLELLWGWRGEMLLIGLGAICAGTVLTIVRRTRHLARALSASSTDRDKAS